MTAHADEVADSRSATLQRKKFQLQLTQKKSGKKINIVAVLMALSVGDYRRRRATNSSHGNRAFRKEMCSLRVNQGRKSERNQ